MKHEHANQKHSMWKNLAIMTGVSFIAMYGLMYMMVDKFENIHLSFNQFYMAAVMTTAMVIIELIVMGGMYKEKSTKYTVLVVSLVCLILFYSFTRKQIGVSDRDFLKSMIPHHGGAILMCKNPNLHDFEIQELCKKITSSQQSEINWMQSKLTALK